MEPHPPRSDWRVAVLLVCCLAGASIPLGVCALLLGMFLVNGLTVQVSPPLPSLLGATSLGAIGLLMLPAGVLSWQRLSGRTSPELRLRRLALHEWVGLGLLWALVLALATLSLRSRLAPWVLPFLHFLAVALPVYMLLRAGIGDLMLGSRLRAWGVATSGYSLSLVAAILLEGMLALAGLLAVAVYLGMHPTLLGEVERLAHALERAADLEDVLAIAAPVIRHPASLLAALGFLSVLVPVVEELAKSIGIWLVADRLGSPGQGLALGLLSGAGFALAESLFATLSPEDAWALTFLTRAASSCMHMLATGVVGMGIASARLRNQPWRFAAALGSAIALHSAWNAGAVLTVAGGLRVALAEPQLDPLGILAGLAGVGLLLVLALGMFASLPLLNRRLQEEHVVAGTPGDRVPPPVPGQGRLE